MRKLHTFSSLKPRCDVNKGGYYCTKSPPCVCAPFQPLTSQLVCGYLANCWQVKPWISIGAWTFFNSNISWRITVNYFTLHKRDAINTTVDFGLHSVATNIYVPFKLVHLDDEATDIALKIHFPLGTGRKWNTVNWKAIDGLWIDRTGSCSRAKKQKTLFCTIFTVDGDSALAPALADIWPTVQRTLRQDIPFGRW